MEMNPFALGRIVTSAPGVWYIHPHAFPFILRE